MRRNMARGNRRSSGRGGANFAGPLMTDHLKDLDLELQLLKRKRQMLEQQQQQQLINRQEQRGYIYDQPQTYKEEPYDYEEQQDYNRPSNYAHFYDEASNTSYSNKFGNQLGRKRQVESPWDNGAPPKRFSGPKGKFAKKQFGDRSGRSLDHTPEPMGRPLLTGRPSRSPNVPQSLMSLKPKPPIGHRRPAPPVQHNFKPSKVTKPKPVAAANKLDSYPVVERKRLVAEASNLVSDADKDRVLSIDIVPTQQMTGRLELALGSILKDLKQAYSTIQPHVASFQSTYLQRVMKQFIRERIRSVMLGKVVGNVADILLNYRKVFPTNTDLDILQSALDAQEVIDKKKFGIKLVETDDPAEYFSVNMQKLIDVTLNEMFSKLNEIYGNSAQEESMEDVSPKEGYKPNNTSTVDETTTDIDASKLDESNRDNDTSTANETTSEIDACKVDEISTDTSKVDETTTDNVASNLDETTKENDASKADETVTDLVGNKDDDTVKIIDEDTVKTIDEDTVKTIDEDTVKIIDDDTVKIIDDDSVKIVDDAAKVNDSNAAKPVDKPKSPDNAFYKKLKVFKPNSPESRQCEQFIESAIKRRMPKLLRKQIPYIIKLLNLDNMYKTATAAITKKSAEKAGLHVRERDVGKKSLPNTSHSEGANDSLNVKLEQEVIKSPAGPSRYFVKIIARPSLPKRKVMQAFLNDFNPRTIKKHKNMHSLLFVGFTNQEDFEKILAATGTVIGRTTLDIKVSEKANDKRKSSEGQEVEVKVDQTSANSSLDDLITTDLDDKINDLLSSIRKAEEECGNETSGTTDEPIEIADENIEVVSQNDKPIESAKQNDLVIVKTEEMKETSKNNEETVDKAKATESVEQINNIDKELNTIDECPEAGDKVEALKNTKESGTATPTRTSARLANVTPSTIKTRRASRLAQNNP